MVFVQGVKRNMVRLLPHDGAWEVEFRETEARLRELWGGSVLDVQHIGSTAVKGIWAKPILDVAVVVKSYADMDTGALAGAGYEYRGAQPPNGRHLFVLRGKDGMSLHHIHCYEPNAPDFIRCVGFRDYLIAHPQAALQYSQLKRSLAEQFAENRVAYTEAKGEFIRSIYEKL